MKTWNFLVFGAGAIGTYIGGSLAASGQRVVFVEQPSAVETLQQTGLRLDLTNAGRAVVELPPSALLFTASLPEALAQAPFDAAIFALKSFDTAILLETLVPHAAQLPPILCLSNGVENEGALRTGLGSEAAVLAGTVTSSIGRGAAGQVRLERLRGVGVAAGHPLAPALVQVLAQAGLGARLLQREPDMKWSKMLTNLPANASAAILDLTPAQIFDHPGLFQMEMQMMGEALQVMKALGIGVTNLPGVPVRALAMGARLPAGLARPLMRKAVGGGRGAKMPSFHIDLHSGRGRSEVEWLNGAVLRHGQQAGVATPVNRVLTETLLALTRGEIPPEHFARQPRKLLELL